jgi:glycosyltransferase involved in cell wall biosynthesis
MAEPLVSFVVPCYNYARFLPDCLNSIFAQQGGFDFEIIAIDDCSTDRTPEILRGYAADPRVRVVTHAVNRGHVFTVNEGLAATRGRFVARIDPDDRYRPSFLATLLPRFEASSTVGMVYGDAAMIGSEGEVQASGCDREHGGRDYQGNELVQLLAKNFICAPTAIARREAWQRFLPVWEGLAFNDWYFNVMMAREYDFCYVHAVVADYRVHGTNHHSRIVLEKKEEASIFRILEWVFAQEERDPRLQKQKLAARRRIYAAQYLDQADKYFGVGHDLDARRCYWSAIRNRPAALLRPAYLRRLLATYLGRDRYDRIKRVLLAKRSEA